MIKTPVMSHATRSRLATFLQLTRFVASLVILFLTMQSIAAENMIDEVIEFQATECWVKPNSKAQTDCGWLTVPEDWEHPDAQKLKLPVVIYRALNPEPSLDAVIYLSGGPGYPALGHNGEDIGFWRRSADTLFPGRSLIVFDQRGTGLSSPKLECHDGDGSMVWYPVSRNRQDFGDIPSRVHTAYSACAARHLAAGRRLSAFNSEQSATDVEALRRVLKLRNMVLFGISYGTRLTLTVMKLFPNNIKATILDSVIPPQATFSADDSNVFGAVLDRLFQACHQDEICNAAYPELHDQLRIVLAQLEKEPAIVEITNLKSSGPLYVRVDHKMFLAVLHGLMYQTGKLPQLPLLISSVAQGEYWGLKPHVEHTVDNYRGFPDIYDMGAHLAVWCNDDTGGINRQPKTDDSESYPYLRDFVASNREISPCAIWPTKLYIGSNDAVVSNIPTLLLAGALDASTTIEQAEKAAETLSLSHLFVFPANAHVQIRNNKCASKIIDEFLSNPRKRPNPKCLTSLPQPVFITLDGN